MSNKYPQAEKAYSVFSLTSSLVDPCSDAYIVRQHLLPARFVAYLICEATTRGDAGTGVAAALRRTIVQLQAACFLGVGGREFTHNYVMPRPYLLGGLGRALFVGCPSDFNTISLLLERGRP